jgi:hypothetical protein
MINEIVTNNSKVRMLGNLVASTLELNERLKKFVGSEKECLNEQLSQTYSEIDMIVYGLYGITENEIRIIEGKCENV